MNLEQIIEANEKFNKWKIDMENELEKEKNNIEYINKKLNIDEFKALGYVKAKEVFNVIKSNLDYQNQRKQIEIILREVKEKQYPILKKAHYYPIINEMEFLNDNQKKELDKVLKEFYKNYIRTGSGRWINLKFSSEVTTKVLQFLYDNGIIEKNYMISCGCGGFECNPVIISEERFMKFYEYHSLSNEEKAKLEEENEESWYDGYFEIPCWNDGYKEICNITDFEDNIQPYSYFNCTQPDMSLDNI